MEGHEYGGYLFTKILGHGSYGEVFEASKDKILYAIKGIIDPGKGNESLEVKADCMSLSNPFLVKYYESFRDAGKLFIVMENCVNGDLRHFIQKSVKSGFAPALIMKIFIQLLIGLDYLHQRNIYHRDIKPENIFMNETDDVKIGDFGMGKIIDTPSMMASTRAGTPAYMSPEIIMEIPYDGKADVWSLGVVMYELMTGSLPFVGPPQLLGHEITTKEFIPITKGYDVRISNIVHSMLSKDVAKRPTIRGILEEPVVVEFVSDLDLLKHLSPGALNPSLPSFPPTESKTKKSPSPSSQYSISTPSSAPISAATSDTLSILAPAPAFTSSGTPPPFHPADKAKPKRKKSPPAPTPTPTPLPAPVPSAASSSFLSSPTSHPAEKSKSRRKKSPPAPTPTPPPALVPNHASSTSCSPSHLADKSKSRRKKSSPTPTPAPLPAIAPAPAFASDPPPTSRRAGHKPKGYKGMVNDDGMPHGKGLNVRSNGDRYEGEWANGKMEGNGTYTWAPGGGGVWKEYVGEYKDGKKEGQGTMTFTNGIKYIGKWVDDEQNGEGVLVNGDGTVLFRGSWINNVGYKGALNGVGVPHGKGIGVENSGERYEGNWVEGKREGKGVLTYMNGNKYEGEFVKGKFEGRGVFERASGKVYEGEYKANKKEGKGVLTYKNGNKYVGEYSKDKRNGEGVLMDIHGKVLFKGWWTNGLGYKGALNSKGEPHGKGVGVEEDGDFYEGDWVNGKKEGKGKKVYVCGNKYEGDWVNGVEEGRGVFTWIDRKVYKGEYKGGKIEGKGSVTYKNGAKYVGEFVGNERNGEGVLTDPNGKILYKGWWMDGKGYKGALNSSGLPHGKGTSIEFDGVRYEGDWVNGKKEGVGVYRTSAGSVYTGQLKAGKFEGKGTMVFADGDKYIGEWKNDKFEGKGTMVFADGRKYIGEWKNDEPNGEGVMTDVRGLVVFEGQWNGWNHDSK